MDKKLIQKLQHDLDRMDDVSGILTLRGIVRDVLKALLAHLDEKEK